MGQRTKTRGELVNGILLLDKPAGRSSNQALQAAKRLLNARKAGHTGSLDPLGTGLLPLCFGQATKVSSYLLGADKRYVVDIQLGITTTTGDSDGEVLEHRPINCDEADVSAVIKQFIGPQDQMPPMYSALKLNGVPLYKLARKGIVVERKTRSVIAHNIMVLDHKTDKLTLDVHCSSGYYIRSLTEDIGSALGCGAHVAALQRTQAGALTLDGAVTLDELEAMQSPQERHKLLYPSDTAVCELPKVDLSENAAFYLLRGQAVRVNGLPEAGMIRMYDNQQQFLGLGEVNEAGSVSPKKLMVDLPAQQSPAHN